MTSRDTSDSRQLDARRMNLFRSGQLAVETVCVTFTMYVAVADGAFHASHKLFGFRSCKLGAAGENRP